MCYYVIIFRGNCVRQSIYTTRCHQVRNRTNKDLAWSCQRNALRFGRYKINARRAISRTVGRVGKHLKGGERIRGLQDEGIRNVKAHKIASKGAVWVVEEDFPSLGETSSELFIVLCLSVTKAMKMYKTDEADLVQNNIENKTLPSSKICIFHNLEFLNLQHISYMQYMHIYDCWTIASTQ